MPAIPRGGGEVDPPDPPGPVDPPIEESDIIFHPNDKVMYQIYDYKTPSLAGWGPLLPQIGKSVDYPQYIHVCVVPTTGNKFMGLSLRDGGVIEDPLPAGFEQITYGGRQCYKIKVSDISKGGYHAVARVSTDPVDNLIPVCVYTNRDEVKHIVENVTISSIDLGTSDGAYPSVLLRVNNREFYMEWACEDPARQTKYFKYHDPEGFRYLSWTYDTGDKTWHKIDVSTVDGSYPPPYLNTVVQSQRRDELLPVSISMNIMDNADIEYAVYVRKQDDHRTPLTLEEENALTWYDKNNLLDFSTILDANPGANDIWFLTIRSKSGKLAAPPVIHRFDEKSINPDWKLWMYNNHLSNTEYTYFGGYYGSICAKGNTDTLVYIGNDEHRPEFRWRIQDGTWSEWKLNHYFSVPLGTILEVETAPESITFPEEFFYRMSVFSDGYESGYPDRKVLINTVDIRGNISGIVVSAQHVYSSEKS